MGTTDIHIQIWEDLKNAFPQSDFRPGTRDLYARRLADIPDDELVQTVNDGIETQWHFTRMPTIAEIRQHWTALRLKAIGVPLPEEAWGEVMAELKRCGAYRAPKFSSDLVKQALRAIGGWQVLVSMESSDEIAPNRARFIDAYEGMLARAKHTATMTPEVRTTVLGAGTGPALPAGGLTSVSALLMPPAGSAASATPTRQRHIVYREATPQEIAAGDYWKPQGDRPA